MRRRLLLVLLTLALACAAIAPVAAYDDDTHYYFTYYLSRLVGYTPMQAFRIASADIGIDYAAETNPEQYARVFWALHADVSDRRVRFHAFRDSRVFNDDAMDDQFGAVRQAIDRAGASLWTAAERLNNPGVYLHFLQDIGPHDPYLYGSEIGHAIHNHWPDFLSADQVKAERMARDTIDALTRFMHDCCPHQKSRTVAFERDIRPVLAKLIEVNPAPPLPGGRLGKIMLSKLGLEEEIPGENVNSQVASVVIKQALGRLGDGDWMPPLGSRRAFEFSATGEPQDSELDAIRLTGDLTLIVADPDGRPLGGVVGRLRIGPRAVGAAGSLSGAAVSAANGAMTFDRLPVGEIEVELSRPQFRDQTTPVTLDRGERIVNATLRAVTPGQGAAVSVAKSNLRVRVVDVDTEREVPAEIRAAGKTLSGGPASYVLTPGVSLDVAPGVYEVSAKTPAREAASAWADVPAGRTTDVELRIGDDRANSLAAGIAALRREIDSLLHHPALARRPDLETLRPLAKKIAATLAVDRVEAAPLAAELTGVVLPACQTLARARALQPAAVATAERDAERTESLLAEVRKQTASCTDQASLDRARQSYAEAVRLVAGIQRLVEQTAGDPDRVREAAQIVDSSKPLVERAAVLAARLKLNRSQADAMSSIVAPAVAYNDEVERRGPALARRVNELKVLAQGDSASLAELAEIGGLIDRIQKLPVGSLESALAEAEQAIGLATALERPVAALRNCPTMDAAETAALVDRLQTASMLSQLTLLSEGAETQRGLDTCKSKLVSSAAATAGPGALPTERRLEDIIVTTREVTITVWDAACEDGDRITVRVNGAAIFQDYELKNAKASRTTTLTSDVNSIEVAATSTGHDCSPTTPPDKRVNTGAVSISGAARGGDQQWSLRDRNSSVSRLIVQTGAGVSGSVPPNSVSGSSSAAAPARSDVNVSATSGSVRVVAPGGSGVPAPGSAVTPGSALLTGSNGRADLRTSDGSRITLGTSTQARVTAGPSGGHDVSLVSGVVDIVHSQGAAPLRVVTPHGLIETIGTKYRVERTPDGTIVEVTEGSLRLTGASILRLAMPGQQIGKSSPVTTLELHAQGRAILLPAPLVPPVVGVPASTGKGSSPITAVPAIAPPGATGAARSGGAGTSPGRPSYLPAVGAGGSVASPLSRPDPWNDAQVQSLIDEWLRTAVPSPAKPGQSWRYSDWGVVLAPGAVAAGPPEHPAGWTRHQTVWSIRTQLGSQNLCTLADFVERRLTGRSLTGCVAR